MDVYNRYCYPMCGHRSTAYDRKCHSSHTSAIAIESQVYGFCSTCFLLPDPRAGTPHAGVDQDYDQDSWLSCYLYEPMSSGPNLEAEAKLVWERAAGLLNDNSSDIRGFAGAEYQRLGQSTTAAMMRLDFVLTRDFWRRICSPETPNPTLQERMLILRLRAVLEMNYFEDEAMDYILPYKLVDDLQSRLEPIEIDSLAKDERKCAICSEVLSSKSPQELTGFAVKTSCGHVFGERCLLSWLKDHDSCPICRIKLWNLRSLVEDLEKLAADEAEARDTPQWLITLAGCDPKDYNAKYFHPNWANNCNWVERWILSNSGRDWADWFLDRWNEELLEREEMLASEAALVGKDERVVREDDRVVSEDYQVVSEDERFVREDEQVVREDEPVLREDERFVRADERALREDEEWEREPQNTSTAIALGYTSVPQLEAPARQEEVFAKPLTAPLEALALSLSTKAVLSCFPCFAA